MRKIEAIETEIQLLQPKLSIKAHDFNKEEKEALSKSYHEITKVSTGRGRMLDLGCDSCIKNAAVIVKNYVDQLDVEDTEDIWKDEPAVESKSSEEKSDADWKKNNKTINAYAAELGLEFPEEVKTKAQKIQYITEQLGE